MNASLNRPKEKRTSRYTVFLGDQHKSKIAQLAKTYRITRGEVIEVMLDQVNQVFFGSHFEAKRKSKDAQRLTQASVIKKFKGATPEQLAEIARILDRSKPSHLSIAQRPERVAAQA